MKKFRLGMSIICSIVVTFCSPLSSSALSPTDYVGQGITHYDTRVPCAGGGGGGLSGSTNPEKVFNYFTGKGLSAAAAAGIMGNMQAESTFNPFRMQDPPLSNVLPIDSHSEYMKAFGLVQWDGGRRQDILNAISGKWPDFQTTIDAYGQSADGSSSAPQNDDYLSFELDWIWQELNGSYQSALSGLQAVQNTSDGARQASVVWDTRYEISDGSASDYRADNAAGFFDQFSAGGSSGSTTSTSVGSGLCGSATPGGDVVYYSQLDPKWADSPYAGDTIANVGCGPTSMAIILATLVDKSITPPDVAAVAGNQSGGTSNHQALISGVMAKWPVNITGTLSLDEAIQFVRSGQGLVWMGGQGAPPFTQGGHLVAMVGVTSDGMITIADPVGDGSDGAGQLHAKIKDYTKAEIQAGMGSAYGVSKQ